MSITPLDNFKAGDVLIIETELRNTLVCRIDNVLLGGPHFVVVLLDISVKKGHSLRVGQQGTLHFCKPKKPISLEDVREYIDKYGGTDELGKGFYGLLTQSGVRPTGLKILSWSKRGKK